MKRPLRAADLFCGLGGFTEGARRAGVDVLLAVNHWRTAVYSHQANHPETRHICARIDDVDPRHDRTIPELDMLLASPECFAAGTLILADRGPLPIETIKVGDVVLTHALRWRRVTAVMKSTKDTIIVRGHGHFGIETTAEHPFYSRDEFKQWDQAARTYRRHFTEPRFVQSHSLPGAFWATPVDAERLDTPQLPVYWPGFWWMVGRWLADGTCDLREKGGSVSIACGKAKLAALQDRLPTWTCRELRTASLVETRDRVLADWLVRHFGKLAHGKLIPGWALVMAREYREDLLAGYLSGDGSESARNWDCVTVSKALAIGIRLLAESLGHRASLHFVPARPAVIEGREVQTRDQYRVKWVKEPKKQYAIQDGHFSWSRVASVEEGRKAVAVYNLSVEEDESYVADGLVVHNCTHHSIARGGRPIDDQKRATPWHVVLWAEVKRPKWVIVENVREFRDWGPLDDRCRPIKSRKGETFRAWVRAIESLGYQVDHQLLNAADFGAATSRTRLFIVARRGRSRRDIPWPGITHPKDRWRPAAEIIDWSRPCPSIFGRKRPLAEKTLRRIEIGLRKFVGPFVVTLRRNMGGRSPDDPLATITAGAEHHGVCVPFFLMLSQSGSNGTRIQSAGNPLGTITCARGGERALVLPYLVPNFGERAGQVPRTHDVGQPLPAVTSHGAGAVAMPFFLPRQGFYDCRRDKPARSVDEPVPTITANHGPGHLVLPFLTKYYGTGSVQPVTEPIDTITTKDRFGLAMVSLIQTCRELGVVDIGFRMLGGAELAAAQGFPAGYQIFGTKAEQVRQVGNSVAPPVAEALCRCYSEAA